MNQRVPARQPVSNREVNPSRAVPPGGQPRGQAVRLSIIIPTLNEARSLAGAVEQARTRAALGPPHEVIVADCGSVDGTADLAVRLGTRLARGQPLPGSRAAALNLGAAQATGDVLLFLDADTLVPRGYD